MVGPVDPAGGTDVGGLAGVLLHVGAGDTDAGAVGQVEVAADVDRLVVLADLIVLRHVRIEVVLPVEDARLDGAVQRFADAHGVLDGLTVDHRQRARQPEADRADVGVGLGPEPVGAAAEQLGGGVQLAVDLEPDDELPRAGGGRLGGGHRSDSSSTWAARNMVASPSAGASSCTPTGRSSAPVP